MVRKGHPGSGGRAIPGSNLDNEGHIAAKAIFCVQKRGKNCSIFNQSLDDNVEEKARSLDRVLEVSHMRNLSLVTIALLATSTGCVVDTDEPIIDEESMMTEPVGEASAEISTSPCQAMWNTGTPTKLQNGVPAVVYVGQWNLKGSCLVHQVGTILENMGSAPLTVSNGLVQFSNGFTNIVQLQGGMPCVYGSGCPNLVDLASGGAITLNPGDKAVIGARFAAAYTIANANDTSTPSFLMRVNLVGSKGAVLHSHNCVASNNGACWNSSQDMYGTMQAVQPNGWHASQLRFVSPNGGLTWGFANIMTSTLQDQTNGWLAPSYAQGSYTPGMPRYHVVN